MDRASLGLTPCCCLTKHIRTVMMMVGWIDEGSVAGWLPSLPLGLGVGVYDEEGGCDAPFARPCFLLFSMVANKERRDCIKAPTSERMGFRCEIIR